MKWKGIFLSMLTGMVFITCASTGKEDEEASVQGSDAWTVNISGKVLRPASGQITISEIREGGAEGRTDTVELSSDHSFSKDVTLREPGYYRLNFFNRQMVNLILFKTDLKIIADGTDMQGTAEITGSPEIDFIREATAQLQDFQSSPKAEALSASFEEARKSGNQEKMMALQQEYMSLASEAQKAVAAMVESQPASLGVINLLQNNALDRDRFFDTYIEVAEKLRKEWPDYQHAKAFVAMVDQMKTTAIGQPAPEIALPNPDGEVVKLSSLQGNYVLVDFWAKWCGPCRAENPNVVRVFNKYKDKGFTVFGVSLDRSREDWLKAIDEDNLTWTHVSDLKYWQSEAAKIYNINAIPFSLLLDPKGVIIAKNLRGPALEQKLAEIFGR